MDELEFVDLEDHGEFDDPEQPASSQRSVATTSGWPPLRSILGGALAVLVLYGSWLLLRPGLFAHTPPPGWLRSEGTQSSTADVRWFSPSEDPESMALVSWTEEAETVLDRVAKEQLESVQERVRQIGEKQGTSVHFKPEPAPVLIEFPDASSRTWTWVLRGRTGMLRGSLQCVQAQENAAVLCFMGQFTDEQFPQQMAELTESILDIDF